VGGVSLPMTASRSDSYFECLAYVCASRDVERKLRRDPCGRQLNRGQTMACLNASEVVVLHQFA
jgi:hypothetical protein